ncbi:MAG: hypothetical protein R3F43_27530, partial [bacterium]
MKTLTCLILLTFLQVVPPREARADLLWQQAKAYTGHLDVVADAAVQAAKIAKGALELAGQVVAAQQMAVDQIRAELEANPQLVAPGALAAALAQLQAAEDALAIAVATYEALAAAAEVALAAAAAWTAGTLAGQAVVWLEHWCWDPLCDWTTILLGPIYAFAHLQEEDALVEVLLRLAIEADLPGVPRTPGDLVALGPPGVVMLDYLRGQVGLLLTYHRGAAASTAQRHDEVVAAGNDLQRRLQAIPAQQRAFGELLASLNVDDGRAQVADATTVAGRALDNARMILAQAQAERPQRGLAALIADLDVTRNTVRGLPAAVDDALAGARFGDIDTYIRPYSRDDHEAFRRRCAAGADCIPAREIGFLLASMEMAGVRSPELGENLAEPLAAWDAEPLGDDEARFFADGQLTAVESMLGYAEVPERGCGFWRNADLGQSPLLIEARPRVGFGDANDDGALDVLDLQRRVNLALAEGRGDADDDLNGDRIVDVRDIQATVNLILEQPVVGLCPPIPVG